jgi:lipopolysaccharide transport system ATP-binding protein
LKTNNIILKAENISKQYRLGLVGTGTLSHDLNRWWHGLRGKEDPYLKIGDENDRSKKAETDYVWA